LGFVTCSKYFVTCSKYPSPSNKLSLVRLFIFWKIYIWGRGPRNPNAHKKAKNCLIFMNTSARCKSCQHIVQHVDTVYVCDNILAFKQCQKCWPKEHVQKCGADCARHQHVAQTFERLDSFLFRCFSVFY